MFDGFDPRSSDTREREAADPRDESLDACDVFTRDLDLPRGPERERELLESHRSRDGERSQTFYAGAVKSRELSHDAQLCRAYVRTAEKLGAQGARVERVVLDYELKREYQKFLQERNRDRPDSDGRPDRSREEIKQWAIEHDLPVVNDRVQFPDFRIEYEHADGRRDAEN